ncbi:cobalamin biosynthesis protein CbiG [Saccharopolyspora lacisalsi]|uniref:Cobalamin biosynthesis protein CbiG n=1 Tax=Halosaccharopolyspora lacisalsi TaxID=1000566 RepID=A0A839DRH1_9PSEU|nr:cobalamin biosynthesis protein [Halosaccharopolyspora lacisalsi]MBA8823319.1 cobalamin biosynthesis protein CbiG [Halosaccharopolyspora lacisalsi]
MSDRPLAIGLGASSGAPRTAVTEVLARLVDESVLSPRAVRAFATVEARAGDPAILEAVRRCSSDGAVPLWPYPAAELAGVAVPGPSELVRAEIGISSVAEAAALRAASEWGAGAELVAGKTRGDRVTVAVARIGTA